MTTTSRYPAVMDAVVAALQAASGLSTAVVSDGLPMTEDRLTDLVIVGNAGQADDTRAGTISQEYHDLAGVDSTRDETVTIPCCVIAQTGDVDVSATRTRAFSLLGTISDTLRANYKLGVAGVIRVELSDAEVYVEQFADGTAVRVTFTLTATSLI